MRAKVISSFNTWITAQSLKSRLRIKSVDNISLEGIARLRELILELAIRGKLVPQNSNDEKASVQLKKIQAKRQQLINDGELKISKSLSEAGVYAKPFDIPFGWEWTSLDHLAPMSLVDGDWIESKDQDPNGSIRLIQLADIGEGKFLNKSNRFINEEAFKRLTCTKLKKNDILIARLPDPIGRACMFPGLDQDAITVVDVAILRPLGLFCESFLINAINSKTFRSQVESFGKGTTRFRISTGSLKSILVPLPPVEEQSRIVEKINELMSLCDDLEQQETNHLKSHQLLVQTLLGTLTNAGDADEFQTAWGRLEQHFDDLFTTEDSIDQLKQTILQLAVMGKLVPQDPKDEPASVLLERIEIEKEMLIKKGTLKSEKPLPIISSDETPYELPIGWQWCRMKDLCPNISSGSTPPKTYFKQTGIPYLKVYNIRSQKIDFEYQEQFVDKVYHRTKLSRSILRPGDVIMNIVGPPLGKVAIIPDSYPEWNCNQAITFFRPLEKQINKWIYTFLLAGTFLNYIELIGTAGQDNISVTKSKMIMVPLPPLSEQLRIVKMLDDLFALCDRLKERIGESQKVVNLMAETLVEQV